MGDPRKIRSKYQGPRHPWNKERIETEKKLLREYGLVNKKELWKVESQVKNYKDIIKGLIARRDEQSDIEREQLFSRLRRLGVIGAEAHADDVLALEIEALLGRRLQTIVFKHELARSIKQARQFITHGHILIGDKKVSVPGYIVPVEEEAMISFSVKSTLFNPEHPERAIQKQATGASEDNVAKSPEAEAQEEAPVVETQETPEEEKPIEQKIEEETANAEEVTEAVKEAEADNLAVDKEQEVAEEAAVVEKAEKEAEAEELKKEDAQ